MKRKVEHERVKKRGKYYPSFYQITHPIPGISQQLQIPADFVEHINKSAFKRADLKDTSGRSWPVKLLENEIGIFLEDGWNWFVEDHSLRYLDFLTFTYDGDICFDVRIFNANGVERVNQTQGDPSNSNESNSFKHHSVDEIKSEKGDFYDLSPRGESLPVNVRRKRGRPKKNFSPHYEPPFSPHRKGPDVQQHGLRDSQKLEAMNASKMETKAEKFELSEEELAFGYKNIENEKIYQRNEGEKVREKGPHSSSDGEKMKRRISQKHPLLSERKEKGKAILSDDMEYLNPKENKWPKMEIKDEVNELFDDEPVFHPKKTKYSKSNKTEVKGATCAGKGEFGSKYPFFEKYIGLDNINRKYLCKLPRKFADKYLLNKYKAMTLTNENGNSWEVNFIPSGKFCARFCGGWISFMRDNELKLGDHCRFELVSENEMKVYISRL